VTPIRTPNANVVAERVIGMLCRECLDHLIALNERHLLQVLREYVGHCNRKRPHRALARDSPDGRSHRLFPGQLWSSADQCSEASTMSTNGRFEFCSPTPATARATTSASHTSPCTTVRPEIPRPNFAAFRTNAVTRSPRWRHCSTRCGQSPPSRRISGPSARSALYRSLHSRLVHPTAWVPLL
jgi:Integrase core domain